VNIVKAVDGTVYLSGDGSAGYQDDAALVAAGIDVVYQRFTHPVYPQRLGAEFMPGLSVLDAIFHCGFEGGSKLLEITKVIERRPS
jgi:hypothetical protein